MNRQAVFISAVSLGLLIAVAGYCFTAHDETAKTQARDAGSPTPGSAQVLAHAGQTWGASPFGNEMPQREPEAVRIAKRRAKMAAGNYRTPPEYDNMDLGQLRALAKKGDVFAMVQLGERLSSERAALEQDPAFDFNADSGQQSRDYFIQAIGRGYTRLASVLAATALEKGDKVDAYAWHLVTANFKDADTDYYARDNALKDLTPSQMQAAQKAYGELRAQLNYPSAAVAQQ